MILIDEAMPDCCLICFALTRRGCCAITGQHLAFGEMWPPRPKSCPLIEVEEKRIREKISHTSWSSQTAYVRKEESHDR